MEGSVARYSLSTLESPEGVFKYQCPALTPGILIQLSWVGPSAGKFLNLPEGF